MGVSDLEDIVRPDNPFLIFVGTAQVSAKLDFLNRLSGSDIARFSHHRSVDAPKLTERTKSVVLDCVERGFLRVILVVDVRSGSAEQGLAPVLSALDELRVMSVLPSNVFIELYVALSGTQLLREIERHVSSFGRSTDGGPFLKVFSIVGTGAGSAPKLATLLAIMLLPHPSRMRSIGYGLWSARSEALSTSFVAVCVDLAIPNRVEVARKSLDFTLIAQTFSEKSVPHLSRADHVALVYLLKDHGVGNSEPSALDALDYRLRRTHYRETLLEPLVTRLAKRFSRAEEFLRAVEDLSSEIADGSPALASLLADFRNEVEQLLTQYDSTRLAPLAPDTRRVVTEIARKLHSTYAFPLWPLLRSPIRPTKTATNIGDLATAYEEGLSIVGHAIAEDLITRLLLGKTHLADELRTVAMNFQGKPESQVRSYLVLPSSLSMDHHDEIWQYGERAAIVALVPVEATA